MGILLREEGYGKMLKTYKLYKGKILDVSNAIETLYKVEYITPTEIKVDWLYSPKILQKGQEVIVHDGKKLYIEE